MQSLSKYDQFQILNLIKQEAPVIIQNISLPKHHTICGNRAYLYDTIRSGDIKLFEKILTEIKSNSSEAETILTSVYEELKIRNVPLTFAMQVCAETVLLEQKIFTHNNISEKEKINHETRIMFLRECFEDLQQQKEYNQVFDFIAKFIAKNLRILKRQLKRKQPFFKLPWEEMEFCLIAFIRAKHGLEEHDFLTRMVLNTNKLLLYLKSFLECLSNVDLHDFIDLKTDYRLIKDIYSLNKILWYVDNAVSPADLDDGKKLVIEKSLQVMGEYMKNTSDSPHMSKAVENRLIQSAPKQLKEILTSLRNSLSHTYSLAKKILMEQDERSKYFFESIQNDLKKIGIEITAIILDLKFEVCKTFLLQLTNAENRDDCIKICREVAPFWYEEVNRNKYETEEFKQNLELLEQMENEPQHGYEEVVNFVMAKMKGVSNKEDAYSNLLNSIHCISDTSHRNFYFVKKFLGELSNMIMLEKQTINTSEQISLVADVVGEFSDIATELTQKIVNNAIFSTKKIEHIDRFNTKVSEINYEQEINYIFQEIQNCITSEKQINTFWRNINQKRLLHTTKVEILQKLTTGSFHDILPLIKDLKQDENARKKLEGYLNEGKMKEFKKSITSIDDPFDFFVKNMTEANFFMCNKYKTALKSFMKKAVPVIKESVINDFIYKTMQKIEKYLFSRLQSLKNMSNLNEIAVEMIMLDVCEIYNSISQIFDGVGFLDRPTTILAGKYLRNYLAHGDPLIDVLEYDPRVSLHCHMHNFIHNTRSLTSLENALFGNEFFASTSELKERYSKGLEFASSQRLLFKEIENKNEEGVKVCLKNGADPRGLKTDGKTVLHLSVACDNLDIFKLFVSANTKISESVWHTAVKSKFQNNFEEITNNFIQFSTALMQTALANETTDESNVLEYLWNHDLNSLVKEYLRDRINTKNKRQRTLLHAACEMGSMEMFQTLVNNGADVNARDQKSLTPLHLASVFGHDEIVRVLLQKGAEINCESSTKSTPLFYACATGHKNCVELLLEAKANVNSGPVTPLTIASGCGHKEIVRLLLNSGIVPIGKNATALFEAALNGFEEIVEDLLKFNVNVNETFEDNRTALHVAAENGHYNIVRLLINHNANIEAVTTQGHTALFAAAHNGFIDIVQELLQNESNPNVEITGGYKPIHSASLKGNTEIVELLCKYNTCQDDLNLALCLAVQNSHKETTNILLENGAQPSAFVQIKSNSEYRFTALQAAVLENNYELVNVLLNAGASLNAISAKGLVPTNETALELAAKLGHYNIVKGLVERDGFDGDVEIPLFYAVFHGHKDVVQLLLKSATDIEISSLLKIAVQSNHVDVVEILLKHRSDLDEKIKRRLFIFALSLTYFDIAEVFLENGTKIEQTLEDSPLHVTCFTGNIKAVRFLLARQASVDILDSNNNTPLHHAVRRGQEEIIQLLLNHGADCTKINNHDSVLHCAVASKSVKIAKLIIDNIKQKHENFTQHINVEDADGDTPLMWAAENGLPEMVELLLQYGGKVDLKNKEGKTAMDWAVKSGNCEVVRILKERDAIRTDDSVID